MSPDIGNCSGSAEQNHAQLRTSELEGTEKFRSLNGLSSHEPCVIRALPFSCNTRVPEVSNQSRPQKLLGLQSAWISSCDLLSGLRENVRGENQGRWDWTEGFRKATGGPSQGIPSNMPRQGSEVSSQAQEAQHPEACVFSSIYYQLSL